MSSRDAPDAEAISLLREVETATIGHLWSEGFMAPALQCLSDGVRICGPAFTVSLPADDGAAIGRALAAAKPGDVLVVDRQGDTRHACWGAVTTAAAKTAGLAGAVIDGYVTDVGAIRASGFPVWCRGRSPLTTKPRGGGAVAIAVQCGGTLVRPGDLILADENGVLVVPPALALDVARKALAMQAAEPAILARLAAGETFAAIQATPKA